MKLSDDAIRFFAAFIEKEIGIVYSEANYFQLEHRIETVATTLGFGDVQSFYQNAKQGIHGQIKELLLDVATNNETSFLRDAHVFHALAKKIIPDLLLRNPDKKIRIWSAAGSTGQEAYSIAMTLEQEKLILGDISYSIHVTDYSERVLKKAKDGAYNQLEVQRGLPENFLHLYFEKPESDQHWWRVKSSVKSSMSFSQLNLLNVFPPMEAFDVIFCRNVLIYQTIENKKDVLKRLYSTLASDGFLILGAAESLLGLSDDFCQIDFQGAVFFNKK